MDIKDIIDQDLDELDEDLSAFDEEIIEGFKDNMFCDNTGYCCGTSCKNYFRCHGDK